MQRILSDTGLNHLFSQYLLSTCYVPDAVLGAMDAKVSKTDLISVFVKLTVYGEDRF